MDEREEQDEALIEQLRTALGAEAPPASVTEAAKAALTWRRVDAELAELLSDSAVDAEPALARGAAVVRSVSFSAGRDDRRTGGPSRWGAPNAARAAVAGGAADDRDPACGRRAPSASALSDELGRFRITLDEGGTVRLRIADDAAGTAIETAWIPI